jgi:hypothetical protein
MHRPRLTTSLRILGVAVALVLALLLALRVQARVTRQDLENEIGPVTPDAYASATVPDAENSAIWWRAAAAALDLDEDQTTLVGDLSKLRVGDWTPEQSEGLERVVAQAAPALTLAERAAALRASSWGLSGAQATSPKPDIPILKLLWLARVLNVRARLAVATGDWAVFRLCVTELGGISASLERETPLISLLVGLAVDRMAADVVLTAVQAPSTQREALDGLAARLPDVDLIPAWKRSLGGMATGFKTGSLSFNDVFGDVVATVTGRDEPLDIVLEAVRLANEPVGSDAMLIEGLESRKADTQNISMADMLAVSLLRTQSILSLRRLERLAISVRLEGLSTGRYPETLARWPQASTPDPFTGGTIRFERRADGSAVLEVPGAELAYNRASVLGTFVPYTWELPAPVSASS